MKRKLLACFTSLTLLLSALLVGNVGAHPIIVFLPPPPIDTGLNDRSRAEWFPSTVGTPSGGTGMIQRNSVGQGVAKGGCPAIRCARCEIASA